MATLPPLYAEFRARFQQLRQGVGELRGAANTAVKDLSNLRTQAASTGAGFRAFGGSLRAAAGALGVGIGLGVLVHQTLEADRALQKLRQTLKFRGLGADAEREILDLSSAMEDLTGQDDEVVQGLSTMLLQFGVARGDIARTTKVMLDLSAATGRDAGASILQLQQAMDTGTFSIRGIGSVTLKATDEIGRMNEALDFLEGKVGGAADAGSRGFAGLFSAIQNGVSNTIQGLGALATTALFPEDAGRSVSGFFRTITDGLETVRKSGALAVIGGIFRGLAGSIGDAAKALLGLAGDIKGLDGSRASAVKMADAVARIGLALTIAADGLASFANLGRFVFSALVGHVQAGASRISGIFADLFGRVARLASETVEASRNLPDVIGGPIRAQLQGFPELLARISSGMRDFSAETGAGASDSVRKIEGALQNLSSAGVRIENNFGRLLSTQSLVTDRMLDSAEAAGEAGTGLDRYRATVQGAGDQTSETASRVKDLTSELDHARTAASKLTEAADAFTKKIGDIEESARLDEEALGLTDAEAALRSLTAEGEKARQALRDQFSEMSEEADAALRTVGELGAQIETLPAADAAALAGPLAAAEEELFAAIERVARAKETLARGEDAQRRGEGAARLRLEENLARETLSIRLDTAARLSEVGVQTARRLAEDERRILSEAVAAGTLSREDAARQAQAIDARVVRARLQGEFEIAKAREKAAIQGLEADEITATRRIELTRELLEANAQARSAQADLAAAANEETERLAERQIEFADQMRESFRVAFIDVEEGGARFGDALTDILQNVLETLRSRVNDALAEVAMGAAGLGPGIEGGLQGFVGRIFPGAGVGPQPQALPMGEGPAFVTPMGDGSQPQAREIGDPLAAMGDTVRQVAEGTAGNIDAAAGLLVEAMERLSGRTLAAVEAGPAKGIEAATAAIEGASKGAGAAIEGAGDKVQEGLQALGEGAGSGAKGLFSTLSGALSSFSSLLGPIGIFTSILGAAGLTEKLGVGKIFGKIFGGGKEGGAAEPAVQIGGGQAGGAARFIEAAARSAEPRFVGTPQFASGPRTIVNVNVQAPITVDADGEAAEVVAEQLRGLVPGLLPEIERELEGRAEIRNLGVRLAGT